MKIVTAGTEGVAAFPFEALAKQTARRCELGGCCPRAYAGMRRARGDQPFPYGALELVLDVVEAIAHGLGVRFRRRSENPCSENGCDEDDGSERRMVGPSPMGGRAPTHDDAHGGRRLPTPLRCW